MDQKLIQSIYNPPKKKHDLKISNIYSQSKVSLYPYSRHALKDGCIACGIKKSASVLVPSFLCRDVLSAFYDLGVHVLYYDLDDQLRPKLPYEELPFADAIMVVHYFGFETEFEYFRAYCEKHNSILIEDNAHGFLSRSSDGRLLGTKGDLGIISVRKTIPLSTGALLLLNHEHLNFEKSKLAVEDGGSIFFRAKKFLRPLVGFLGVKCLLLFSRLKLLLSKPPISNERDEQILPPVFTVDDVEKYFSSMDIEKEVERRRKLYVFVGEILRDSGVKSFKNNLGSFESPYVFPFVCEPQDLRLIKKKLYSHGLETVSWPDLPGEVLKRQLPAFYRNTHLVKFLW